LTAVKTIFLKELRIEFRNKQMINIYFILSLMILASFRFTFSIMDFDITELASPILWITFFFAGMFSLSPIYKREIENGTKEGLLLAPISLSSIFFGKLFANLLIILLLELFSLLIFFVFFPVIYPDFLALITIVIIGTIGFVALGNIISAISSSLVQSEIMIPVLLVPVLLFTVIMSAVGATSSIFAGAHLMNLLNEIRFMLAFDFAFIAIGYLLIDYILEI